MQEDVSQNAVDNYIKRLEPPHTVFASFFPWFEIGNKSRDFFQSSFICVFRLQDNLKVNERVKMISFANKNKSLFQR